MVELFEKKGKTLPLYVYSSNTDSIRLVQLTPNRKWGGNNSCLGCDIGTGYLHRIPMSRNILPATQLTNLSVQYPTHPGQVSLTGKEIVIVHWSHSISAYESCKRCT